jgi:16S rRNA (guanine527-N7)-methyltransferase
MGSGRLDASQEALLRAYLGELEAWNLRVNLTRVTPDRFWARHVDESLDLLALAAPAQRSAVVDVGSGAGLPGMVIAIARPDLRVVLVESTRRKAAFLMHVAGTLGLSSVTVAAVRAEEAGHDPALRESFDVAFSRAAAPPSRLMELALPLVTVGGTLIAAVAEPARAAAACEQAAHELGGATPIAHAGAIAVRKMSPTPVVYPRRPEAPRRARTH